jgi:hypothetical protein
MTEIPAPGMPLSLLPPAGDPAVVAAPGIPVARPAPSVETAPRSTLDLLAEVMTSYARSPEVRRISVVGNAPLGPSTARAAAIDAGDLVIRVNGFALDEPDGPPAVGRRADVVVFQWAVKATPWLFEDYSRRLYLLNEPGQMFWNGESVPPWWPADLGLMRVPNREITVPLISRLGLQDAPRPRWGTTGTVAVHLAASVFPDARVDVTGFSFLDDPTQTSWAHAYGAPCAVNDEHDLRAEAAYMRRMVQEGRLAVLR